MGHDASVEQQILATIDKWVEQELPSPGNTIKSLSADLVEQIELGLLGTIWALGGQFECLDLRSNRLAS